jgi:hypothetical protein
MSHKFSNDKALSYAVMVEYNTMVHNGTLNQSISRGLLNVWLQNRGLSKLPEKVSPTLLHVFQALYTLATTDETF